VALVAKRRFEEIEIRLVLEEIVRLVDGEFDVRSVFFACW